MMNTGTQTQVPSHWVERTFLKSCSRTLPTPTRPRLSHCPASACALQFAGSARPQRGYRGSLSESYWKSGRRQAEAVGDAFIQAGGVARPAAWGSRPRPYQGAQQPALGLTPQTQTLSQEPSLPAVAPAPGRSPARRRLSLSTQQCLGLVTNSTLPLNNFINSSVSPG